MKNLRWSGLLLAVLCLASCSNNESDSNSSTAVTTTLVGDFNFIAQDTKSPQHSAVNASTSIMPADTTTYATDIYGAPIVDTTQSTSISAGEDDIIDIPADTTAPVYVSPEEISTFVDYSTDVSLRIGKDIYVSVPYALLQTCTDLDTFMDNTRVAYNLVSEEDKAKPEIQKQRYASGTCLHLDESKMYIDGYGMGYWIKCFSSAIEDVKAPTMDMFNLGKIAGNLSSVTKSYSKLGELLSNFENDYYYKAVYSIADLKNNANIDARAVIMYDKATSSASTCIVYINKAYYVPSGLEDLDFIASSVRYSVVVPDNLATIDTGF